MDNHASEKPIASKGLRLRVTPREHEELQREAATYGCDLSTLLRLRIFGELKGLKVTRRPSADMVIFADIIGKLTALTSEINKIGSNLNQISKKLNLGSKDVFGLDSCLRLFEELGRKIVKVLGMIEASITGRNKPTINEEK